MKIKNFKTFLFEKYTSESTPPEYLVLPALDPETQTPNDKMYAYMKAEHNKSKSYFKPNISSAGNADSIE